MPYATQRSQAVNALWALAVQTAGIIGSSQRFISWDNVSSNLPFMTMLRAAEGETRERQDEGLPILRMFYNVFVYTLAPQANDVFPDANMNALLDALDQAVKPVGFDLINGNKQTLGGLVSHCYPLGRSFIDPGETDGKGVAAVTFEMMLPWIT
jgi:hypothetical protein